MWHGRQGAAAALGSGEHQYMGEGAWGSGEGAAVLRAGKKIKSGVRPGGLVS